MLINKKSTAQYIIIKITLILIIFILQSLLVSPVSVESRKKFDHFTTSFQLTGSHKSVKCDECHVRGSFKGTPKKCHGCHRPDRPGAASGKTKKHVKSSTVCDDCHNTRSWSMAKVDHDAVIGTCVSCHKAAKRSVSGHRHIESSNSCESCHTSRGWSAARMDHNATSSDCSNCHSMPKKHISSVKSCDDCHTTRNWSSVTVDHQSLSGECSKCHKKSGGHISSSRDCSGCHTTKGWGKARVDHNLISGSCIKCHRKPGKHVASSSNCQDCHTTKGWGNANVDHSSLSGSCSGCHKKSGNHIASSSVCDDCHTTKGWGNVNVDHNALTSSCSSCHQKPGNHMASSNNCDDCHKTTSWGSISSTNFQHSSGNYPGDHNSGVGCNDCHISNSSTVNWKNSSYKPDCAGCHAKDYKQREHKKVKSPLIYYSVSELRDCSGPCHEYKDSSMASISKSRNSRHRAGKGGF